ncbi:MAG: SH3 domain-containing protein [Desulfosarcina sp.]|nr:SH3 domain-containing protein [Desulfobacterales bacterium]
MRKNINLYINLIFFIMVMITCLSINSFATETMYGEVISRVNLRQAPGMNEKIITGIPGGTLVIVKDQQADWYRVAISGTTYAYEGWIYGKFLKLISIEKKIPNDQKKTMGSEAHETIPDEQSIDEQSIEEPPVYKNIGQADLSSKSTSDPVVYTKEPELLRKKPIEAATGIKTEEKKIDEKNNTNSLNTGKVPGKIISSVTEQKKDPLISNGKISHKGNTGWLRLLLTFASIILSCLAVLLSYKALQSAGETREMVLRLRNNSLDQ